MEDLAFATCAILSVISALAAVMNRGTPVYSVMCLLPMLVGIALIFVMLSAPFVAAMQVALYGGAVIVLFLFAVMILNVRGGGLRRTETIGEWMAGATLAGCLIGILAAFAALATGRTEFPVVGKRGDGGFGSAGHIGGIVVADLVVPFELVSILIVAVLVGAVLILGRDFWRNRGHDRGAPS
ncbi:MAG: NADH-quinone oxidoreductase subunit J [Planctomycetota bacterium]|nr:NADH-quinone oxidoreductase subunit J [Planctomycetota bacterium]